MMLSEHEAPQTVTASHSAATLQPTGLLPAQKRFFCSLKKEHTMKKTLCFHNPKDTVFSSIPAFPALGKETPKTPSSSLTSSLAPFAAFTGFKALQHIPVVGCINK